MLLPGVAQEQQFWGTSGTEPQFRMAIPRPRSQKSVRNRTKKQLADSMPSSSGYRQRVLTARLTVSCAGSRFGRRPRCFRGAVVAR